MSALDKRVTKLEGTNGEEITVLIHSWTGDGEYYGVKNGDQTVVRKPDETEQEFLSRAEDELVLIGKAAGRKSPFTFWAVRHSEIPD